MECFIKERKETILDLKFNVPSKSLAISICDSWQAKSTDVYSYLMNELLGNKTE